MLTDLDPRADVAVLLVAVAGEALLVAAAGGLIATAAVAAPNAKKDKK